MISLFLVYSYLRIIEPLQKLRARLGSCKSGLSSPLFLYYLSFQGDTSMVVLIVLSFGVEFLCLRFHIFS